MFLTFEVPTLPSSVLVGYGRVHLPVDTNPYVVLLVPEVWIHSTKVCLKPSLWRLWWPWTWRSTMSRLATLRDLLWNTCLRRQELSRVSGRKDHSGTLISTLQWRIWLLSSASAPSQSVSCVKPSARHGRPLFLSHSWSARSGVVWEKNYGACQVDTTLVGHLTFSSITWRCYVCFPFLSKYSSWFPKRMVLED
jgi:hypothetical protein